MPELRAAGPVDDLGQSTSFDGEESTPGATPWSTHTNTDAATEFDTLRVGTPRPEHRHVVLPSDEPRSASGSAPLPDLVAALTKSVGQATAQLVSAQLFGRFKDTTAPGRERLAQFADVSDDAERALWEQIQQRQLTQAQRTQTVPCSAGRGSMFQCLGSRADPPAEGEEFQVCPEMTPRKIQWGRQPSRGSETSEKQTSHSLSGQKRRSASRSHDQVDPKKGKTDASGQLALRKAGTRRYWSVSTGKLPPSKNRLSNTSSQHPSFRPDRTGAPKLSPEPKVKSAVVVKGPSTKSTEPSGHHSQTPARSPKKKNNKPLKPPRFKLKDRELTEKEMVRDRAYDWIAARVDRLDPRGYVEETCSLKFFGHQQVTYGLEIVAIIDWARRYLELGMVHPLPTLPMYLFSSFVASRQTANSPLKKDDGMYTDTDDIRERFHRGWILMAAVLQFWTDEQSIQDGEINGGWIRPASALAQYVMKSLNHFSA